MAKLGLEVDAYEPDQVTYSQLVNLSLNSVSEKVSTTQKAVSISRGKVNFTRVIGNTTGSHISGAKDDPYGELETFDVETEKFSDVLRRADFVKIDAEGHEADLIECTTVKEWTGTEAIVEIGSKDNAFRVYEHLKSIDVNLFAQKIGWQKVSVYLQVPTSYRHGSVLLVGMKICHGTPRIW